MSEDDKRLAIEAMMVNGQIPPTPTLLLKLVNAMSDLQGDIIGDLAELRGRVTRLECDLGGMIEEEDPF